MMNDSVSQRVSPDGEFATYREYLAGCRSSLLRLCEGLTAEQLAQKAIPPSSLSLLGLVRHLAAVEHNWTQRCLEGRLERPRLFGKDEHEDADFDGAVADDRVVSESQAAWTEQTRSADAVLDKLADADLGQWRPLPRGTGEITVRDALVHLIEEYARHLGHADILREQIDGRVAL